MIQKISFERRGNLYISISVYYTSYVLLRLTCTVTMNIKVRRVKRVKPLLLPG
jgi:hypothetical protein